MSPIVFDLCLELSFHPVLAILSLSLGGLAGGIQPWTSSGVLFNGIAASFVGEELANAGTWTYGIILWVVPTLFVIICFFLLNKNFDARAVKIEEPKPFKKNRNRLFISLQE